MVTIYPTENEPKEWEHRHYPVVSDVELLEFASESSFAQMKAMRQSSFGCTFQNTLVYPSSNGFLEAVYSAYTHHHNLIIRPEDVWLAILVQLRFYMNGNSEEVRDMFVQPERNKGLTIVDPAATFSSADFGKLVLQITELLRESVKGPELQSWVLPDFSTTTLTDEVVASAVFMGATQQSFKYNLSGGCGLPSVRLLGCQDDWELILRRVEKLPAFGEEPALWYTLLKPVLSRFVKIFKLEPFKRTGGVWLELKAFWRHTAHHNGGGSAPSYLSGWLTAFCFWNRHGDCLHNEAGLSEEGGAEYEGPGEVYELDGISYHRVSDVEIGFASVPVTFNDLSSGKCHEMLLVAGSVGMELTGKMEDDSGDSEYFDDEELHEDDILDTVQPLSGWWIFEKQECQWRIRNAGDQIIQRANR